MKRMSVLALLMVLVMVFSLLSGCGSQASNQAASSQNKSEATVAADKASEAPKAAEGETKASAEKKKFKIGMSIDTTNQPWRAGLVGDVTAEAKKHPEVELIVTDGQGTSSKQISDVEDLITKKVDAILISPNEGQPLTPVCAKAYKAGIPVLVLDREIEGDQFTTFIGANNKTIGKQAGEFVLKYMTDNKLKGVVEIQGNPGSSPMRDRTEPFEAALSQNKDIKIVAKQTANWNGNEGLQVMENLLQAHPKGTIDVVYAQCDAMALGAIKAIKAANRTEIKVVSIDGQKEALQAIKNNEMIGTFTYPFPGAEGVKTALKILNGEKVEKNIEIPSLFINAENVDKYYDPNSAF